MKRKKYRIIGSVYPPKTGSYKIQRKGLIFWNDILVWRAGEKRKGTETKIYFSFAEAIKRLEALRLAETLKMGKNKWIPLDNSNNDYTRLRDMK